MKVLLSSLSGGRAIVAVYLDDSRALGRVCKNYTEATDAIRLLYASPRAMLGDDRVILAQITPDRCPTCKAHSFMPCVDGDLIVPLHPARSDAQIPPTDSSA